VYRAPNSAYARKRRAQRSRGAGGARRLLPTLSRGVSNTSAGSIGAVYRRCPQARLRAVRPPTGIAEHSMNFFGPVLAAISRTMSLLARHGDVAGDIHRAVAAIIRAVQHEGQFLLHRPPASPARCLWAAAVVAEGLQPGCQAFLAAAG